MREILFRGKRLDNGEWVEGWYQPETTIRHLDGRQETVGVTIAYKVEEGFLEDTLVDPSTVCQYTGLKDKNGNRIWEGDIIDASEEWWDAFGPAGHSSPIIPVKWCEYYCGFDPFANYDCDCGVFIKADNCIVIGNVHDNPELLEK